MMRNLNKTVLALLAASVMTTSAFAASDEGATDRIQSAKGSVEALSIQC
jgi:ABC-type cobalt transport system substrate-binding protein